MRWNSAYRGALYESNGTTFAQTGSAYGTPLLLPTGQVLILSNVLSLDTPTGAPQPSWAPRVASAPRQVVAGQTYTIAGTQFNGLSEAIALGDEYQNATNYPLVRLTNRSTRHVWYARTHDHSSMGVATGQATVSTKFDLPATVEKGATLLQVVANGIASPALTISVR